MPFNIFNWLFQDPITAGGPNSDGSEVFHYFWPYLIFCGVGLLIWFYYWVEGRKRFLKDDSPEGRKQFARDYRPGGRKLFVKNNPVLREMLDRFLNWLAIICFIGIPIDLARFVLDGYFFAWRFWRYLWFVALLVWAVWWIVYCVRVYPQEMVGFNYRTNRRASENKPNPASKSNPKPTPKQKRQKKQQRGY